MSRTYPSLALVLLLAGVAPAQDDRSKPVAITLHAPQPALRKLQYPLLVPVAEQRPGNAITDYKEANKKHQELRKDEGYTAYEEKLAAWQALPLAELPRKEMAAFFKQYAEVFAAIEAGAHREHADWEHLEGLRKKGVASLLGEDIQRVRGLIRLVALRIRFHLAEGKIDRALKDLQTGFTMARHTGESPTLIGSLVGVALEGIMLNEMEEVLRQPGVPNLYWALGDVPASVGTFQKPLQAERVSVYGSFPGFLETATDLDAGPITAEQVQSCVKALSLIQDRQLQGLRAVANDLQMGLAIEKKHEAAKKTLVAAGRPKVKVDAMPHVQVAILHALLVYDQMLDEMQAALQLPPGQIMPRFNELEKQRKSDPTGDDIPALPLAKLALPGVGKVYRAHLRNDRRFAVLRCVEALRLYAAAHDGKFPAALKDVKEVAVPIDPGTSKDLEYRLAGDTATLRLPSLAGETNAYPFAMSYELTFKR